MCSSPTHDAIGAGAGLLALHLMLGDAALKLCLLGESAFAAGLLLMVGCTVVIGLVSTKASIEQRERERPLREPRTALRRELRERYRVEGMDRDEAAERAAEAALARYPHPRWDGPAREVRRKWRLVAFAGALVSAWPVAISYATSRLPDQTEIGSIEHRRETHSLLTIVALLAGLYCGLRFGLPELGATRSDAREVAESVTLFVAIGVAVGHVLGDLLTEGGVKVLWPFVDRDLHLLPEAIRPKAAGAADAVLMLAVSGGTVWLALSMGGWA